MMSRCLAKAVLALAVVALPVGAVRAEGDLPCDSFMKNDDGSWSALRSVAITGTGEKLTIREGSVLRPGADIRGLDLATMLDRKCPATPATMEEPAPSVLPSVQPSSRSAAPAAPQARIALSTDGDLYGNVDAQRLTCGQLADAPPQDTGLFLAWYSGWLNAGAKKRAVNLAQVGHSIQSVVDYCRGKRDKNLMQVMELMLK